MKKAAILRGTSPEPSQSPGRSLNTHARPSAVHALGILLSFSLLLIPAGRAHGAGENTPDLHTWRAERRAVIKEAASAAKAGATPATFGLLVIPVDFADWRLPPTWDPTTALAPHMSPLQGETLANYYRIASRGRLDLQILLTPLVRLVGERLDYSDVGRQNFHRTRRLATEAITAVRDMGLSFRALDMEGPDRLPGSPDDDGEVDGVLILHAAVGQENDLDHGLIQALQYYIDPPVEDRGVVARNYAVASLQSGLGIWAHEVGHLFGLEDRYDRNMTGASDAVARGGLGIFSLMAAGAWGRGQGQGPALLDAYSAAQVGWIDLVDYRGASGPDTLHHTLTSGAAWRVWTHGLPSLEYFLLETRGGDLSQPFDSQIPSGQLLIYHVDERLAEGEASNDPYPDSHIRVALVEADAGDQLRLGEDLGRLEDLFPGPLGVTEWAPWTWPSSWGYYGETEITVTEILSLDSAVVMEFSDAQTYGFTVDLTSVDGSPQQLQITVRETGVPVTELTARLSIASDPAWGAFPGGESVVDLPLTLHAPGHWSGTVGWQADPLTEPTAETLFHVKLFHESVELLWQERPIVWQQQIDPLAFASEWPGDWTISYPSNQLHTTWHRWLGTTSLTKDGSPVLICTGNIYTSAADWPDARYGNLADVILTSGRLSPAAGAVRIVHAVDGEISRPGSAWDAPVVEIEMSDDSWLPAVPLDGYDGAVIARAHNTLHGRRAFAGEDSLTTTGPYSWRVDVVPLPDRQEPVRLRLRFASDERLTHRGWVIARLESLAELPYASAFPVAIIRDESSQRSHVAWHWPWEPATSFSIETSADQGLSWRTIWEGVPISGAGGYTWAVDANQLSAGLSTSVQARNLVRVLAHVDYGSVASPAVVLYRDGGAAPMVALGQPFPNPSTSAVRFLLSIPADEGAELSLFDVRGRRLRDWRLPSGQQLVEWDGKDASGRRAAAGTYLFQLRAGATLVHRKVVLLP